MLYFSLGICKASEDICQFEYHSLHWPGNNGNWIDNYLCGNRRERIQNNPTQANFSNTNISNISHFPHLLIKYLALGSFEKYFILFLCRLTGPMLVLLGVVLIIVRIIMCTVPDCYDYGDCRPHPRRHHHDLRN